MNKKCRNYKTCKGLIHETEDKQYYYCKECLKNMNFSKEKKNEKI